MALKPNPVIFIITLLNLSFAQISSMQKRTPADSMTMMTEIVLPNDTNVFGNLMGGKTDVLDGYSSCHCRSASLQCACCDRLCG